HAASPEGWVTNYSDFHGFMLRKQQVQPHAELHLLTIHSMLSFRNNRFINHIVYTGADVILHQFRVACVRIYPVAQEDVDQLVLRINPGACTCETCMAEGSFRS